MTLSIFHFGLVTSVDVLVWLLDILATHHVAKGLILTLVLGIVDTAWDCTVMEW